MEKDWLTLPLDLRSQRREEARKRSFEAAPDAFDPKAALNNYRLVLRHEFYFSTPDQLDGGSQCPVECEALHGAQSTAQVRKGRIPEPRPSTTKNWRWEEEVRRRNSGA